MIEDVILVDIIKDVISKMVVKDITSIEYQYGRSLQILKELNDFDNSISYKGMKYPLIAMILPIREERGGEYYAKVKIPRIVIATINQSEGTESVAERYTETNNFKKILYPCYYEFLKRLAWSKYTIGNDPDALIHVKMDNPGNQPIGEGSTDYIDSIEILNLEITLHQIKNCK